MARRAALRETDPIEMWGIGQYGVIRDVKDHLIPPEAFSNAENVRFTDNGIERFLGDTQIFGTPTVVPFIIRNVPSVGVNFWLYASLTKMYGYDGTNHTNITRQTASVDVNYTPTFGYQWQSTFLGGIPIFNNGADIPQYWPGFSLATKMANLTAWPTTLRAKIVKAFGPYLIAFNLTDTGVSLPKAIRWSSFADPGSLPASWDYTDASVDAGQRYLTDDKGGQILDALLLGNQGVIYTEFATHVARFVGGIDIFTTDLLLKESGILTSGCAAAFNKGMGHFVVTQDDIIIHQGTKDAQSIVEKMNKKQIFAELDPTTYRYAFAFENPVKKEVWFCYPTIGATYPNKAFVWDYLNRTQTFREIDAVSADMGPVFAAASGLTWNNANTVWDEGFAQWSAESRQKLVISSAAQTKMFSVDEQSSLNAGNQLSFIERTGLAIDGKGKDGKPKGSIQSVKQLKRIWPKITGTSPVQVQVGSQDVPQGSVTWGPVQTYNPLVDTWLDVMAVGKLLAYRVEHTGSDQWKMEGVDFQIEVLSRL